MAKQPAGSVDLPGPFREAIALLREGQLDQGALAFCHAAAIQTEDVPRSSMSRRDQVSEQLSELLSVANFESVSWWADVASAWWNTGISVAARGCVAHARRLAINGGIATWEDLCRLAEIDSSEEQRPFVQPDRVALPTPKVAEGHQLKLDRLWSHLQTNWEAESPELEEVLSSDPVASILLVRTMVNLPLSRWIWFWNEHGEPGVAIDHFFAAIMGSNFDQTLFSRANGFWALLPLAESFEDTRDPISAYAALVLLSLSLTSGVASNMSAQQIEERLKQTREKLKELDWVLPSLYSPATTGTDIGVGFQMADWFVANKLPGRFLEFFGEDTVGNVAARYPLLKERLSAMVRNGGWVTHFTPDLHEALEGVFYPSQSTAPFPPRDPALARSKPKTQRTARASLGSWTIRRPRTIVSQPDPDRSIVLNIGLQRETSVRAIQVSFGQYNPLAIIHERARQVLPKLIEQLIREGRSVIWIRDAKQDPSPASVGVKLWSWTRSGSHDRANLLTSLIWSPALQERLAHLLSSFAHIAFREDIRICLDGLLPWVAENPAMLEESARRSRFLRSMLEIRETGLALDGPSGLRRLAVMADSLMNLLDDLRHAAAPETAYYGNARQTPKLAVFDTEAEGRLNTISLLLYVGGLIGLLRNRHELDFKLNPHPRTSQPIPEKGEPTTATLEEQQAYLKNLMARKLELAREPEEEAQPPSIIDGKVADLCIVVSAAPTGSIASLVDWLSPGSIGAGACLLTALDRFPETPDFLGEFQTFVLGYLSDQERLALRTSANISLPPMADDSPAAMLTVSPQHDGMAISSGLLWPPQGSEGLRSVN